MVIIRITNYLYKNHKRFIKSKKLKLWHLKTFLKMRTTLMKNQ